MTTRATRLVTLITIAIPFIALATVLRAWDEMAAMLGDGLSVWITIIGEAVRCASSQ